MNDYKELITQLRNAADAIEQLVNDRNASVDALKALGPNIDVLPTRSGHWVAKKVMARTPFAINYYCSKCKFETDFCTNYCSNCGAKMDEETEHE